MIETEIMPPLLQNFQMRKQDEEEEGDEAELDEDEKNAVRSAFVEYIAGVGAAIIAAQRTGLTEAAHEGARAAGGGLTQAQIDEVIQAAADFNEEHLYGLKDDALEALETLLHEKYVEPGDIAKDLNDLMDAVGYRAEKYAKGGGNAAWSGALRLAGEANGDEGGIWDCHFGPGSCADCIALHGQWMPWDEFEETYQDTECDGGCNCGFHSAANPESISPADLEEEAA